MLMQGRKFDAGSEYRYGFNGKENDNEVKGEGGQQDYGLRIYDPRLGRFLSVDPLTQSYPELTPYQFASNRPIVAIDLDGAEAWDTNDGSGQKVYGPIAPEEAASQGLTPAVKKVATTSEPDIGGIGEFKLREPWEKKIRILNAAEVIANAKPFKDEYGRTVTLESFGEPIMMDEGIGEAEGLSSIAPIYGSGRNMINDFQNGRYISGTFNGIMAISDVFLVKSIVKGVAQGGLKLAGKEVWGGRNGARSLYGESGFAEKYQHLHHWGIEQNSAFGKKVSGSIKNQMFNLIPMEGATIGGTFYDGAAIHRALHGKNAYLQLTTAQKLYFGTPTWLKAGVVSYGGRAAQSGVGLFLNF